MSTIFIRKGGLRNLKCGIAALHCLEEVNTE